MTDLNYLPKILTATLLVFALSGCIAGVQWRTTTNYAGEPVKQMRPCVYFVVCPPWDDPNFPRPYTPTDVAPSPQSRRGDPAPYPGGN